MGVLDIPMSPLDINVSATIAYSDEALCRGRDAKLKKSVHWMVHMLWKVLAFERDVRCVGGTFGICWYATTTVVYMMRMQQDLGHVAH